MKKICYMGRHTTGMLGFFIVLSKHQISAVVCSDTNINILAGKYHIPVFHSINDREFIKIRHKSDLLLCVHGIDKVPHTMFPAINIHPYLYCYKGSDPINRAIKNRNNQTSVAAHYMSNKIDVGEVIKEIRVEIELGNRVNIYNQLYPYYAQLLTDIL